MPYSILADTVVLVHLGFILFVIGGAFLALRWPRAAWFHLPAAGWGAWIEFSGGVCPLTPLENWLRGKAGTAGYEASFLEHHLLPVIYPETLTQTAQIALGVAVLLTNTVAYAWVLHRRSRAR